jgi:hypothetical protein
MEQIAAARQLAVGTVCKHLLMGIEAGEGVSLERFFNEEQQKEMAAVFARTGFGNLTGAHELLGGKIDFDRLRLYRALAQRK